MGARRGALGALGALALALTPLLAAGAGAPPEVTAAVIVWLATAQGASARAGTTINSHKVCAELDLWPGWDGKKFRPPSG